MTAPRVSVEDLGARFTLMEVVTGRGANQLAARGTKERARLGLLFFSRKYYLENYDVS